MKKTVLRIVFIVGIIALMSSCLSFLFSKTHKLTANENLREDQSATVTFVSDTEDGWFFVKELNNRKISTELYGEKESYSSEDKVILTVPAGNTRFLFDVTYTFSNRYSSTDHPFTDIELQYNLEPGKKYRIVGDTKGFINIDFLIRLYDVTGRKTLLKEWQLNKKKE